MTREPSVLTIVLNWRTPEMSLRAAAAALRAMEGIAGAVVIVDNDSGDGSFEAMQQGIAGRDRVRVIQSGHNGGFGAGMNAGMRAGLPDGGQPDYLYLLNSDAFPEPGAIAALLAHMQANPRAGLAGSRIHGADGEAHVTCFRFPSILGEFEGAARIGPISRLLRHHAVPQPVPETTRSVDWLSGASLMIRREVVDEIGGLDERFFLYFEETELCLRAARAGWRSDYVQDSHVEHIGSVSTGMRDWTRVPDYWFASRRYYFVKSHGRGYLLMATLAHLAGAGLGTLWRLVRRKGAGRPRHFFRDLVLGDLRVAFGDASKRKAKT